MRDIRSVACCAVWCLWVIPRYNDLGLHNEMCVCLLTTSLHTFVLRMWTRYFVWSCRQLTTFVISAIFNDVVLLDNVITYAFVSSVYVWGTMLFAVMVRFCVIFMSSVYSFSSLCKEIRCDYVLNFPITFSSALLVQYCLREDSYYSNDCYIDVIWTYNTWIRHLKCR